MTEINDHKVYEQVTAAIRVSVQPVYLDDQSDPESGQYVWAYVVTVQNESHEGVRLMRRRWKIIDENGLITNVEGTGVVGEQPFIEPGDCYEYTSGTPLSTPSGMMAGSYEMESETGRVFDVAIPAFSLDSPSDERRFH